MKSSQLWTIVLYYQFSSKQRKKICLSHWFPKMEKNHEKKCRYNFKYVVLCYFILIQLAGYWAAHHTKRLLWPFPMISNSSYNFHFLICTSQLISGLHVFPFLSSIFDLLHLKARINWRFNWHWGPDKDVWPLH